MAAGSQLVLVRRYDRRRAPADRRLVRHRSGARPLVFILADASVVVPYLIPNDHRTVCGAQDAPGVKAGTPTAR